ncbi:unnamed protein product, partial [Porites evermanni]
MATKVYSEKQLNYFRVCHIATDILPPALRLLFKQEWDNRYKATYGEWKDTPQNGLDFKNSESPANQRKHARLLATMAKGDRAEWDCTMLFYAILFSDSIHGLSPMIRTNVDDLRKFRNEDFAHMTEGQLSNADFSITVAKVERAFRALCLSTADIQTVSKQRSFPTPELQNVKTSNQKLTQDLQTKDTELQDKAIELGKKTTELLNKDVELQQKKDKLQERHNELQEKEAELQENKVRLKTTEEQRKVFEEQLHREVEPFCVLPPKPPHVIASRDSDVASVLQKLTTLRKANVNSLSFCYISGNPGSGKSQLAGLVAENFYKEARKDTTAPSFVMTLNAENLESLLESYFSLARKVSCPAYTTTSTENSKDLNAEQKIAIIKDLIATKIHLYSSWLLVIDNVTNLAKMGQFLPERGNEQWGKGQLLITTQDSACIPPESPITSHFSISEGMIYTEVANLLFELTGITDDGIGKKVAHILDYQPLALASAGVYVRKVRNTNPDFGWEEYLQKLEKGKRERTEEELTKVNNIYPDSMTEATRIAVKAEIDSNKIMKHAFTFLALCAPEPVRLRLLTTYVVNADGELDEEEIGIQIQGSSLLLIDNEGDVNIRLHNVVHDIVKSLVKKQMQTDEHVRVVSVAVESFSKYINEAIPKILQSADSVCESRHIVPHLKTLAAEIKNVFFSTEKFDFIKTTFEDLCETVHDFHVLGYVCYLHGEYLSALDYFIVALKLSEHKKNKTVPDHLEEAEIIRNMASTHNHMGEHQQAKEYYERAMSIELNKLGPDNVDVASTYLNMGTLHHDLGEHQQAKEYYERALVIQLNKLGPDHVDVASTYLNMGNLHKDLGEHQQAKEYFELSLSVELNNLGPDHVDVARRYHNMGNLHKDLGEHQQAKEYYERALSVQLNKLGPDHVDVARTYHNMGNLHHDLGEHQQAKEYYERALSIQLNKLGPDHVDVARTYHNMVSLHKDLGEHQQAKEYYERALSIQLNKLGPDHVDVATTYRNMGNLHHDLGEHQQAKEYYERALSIQLNKLGPDHVYVASAYRNMGNLHHDLGEYQEAKEYYERALSIQLNKLGPDHAYVASTYHNMGKLHHDLGEHQQAHEYYERALSIRLNKLGPDHVNVATTYHNMGKLHRNLGEHRQAKEYYERALSIQLNKLGPDHVDVAKTYHNMGILHEDLGEHQQAKEYCECALSIQLNKLGPDHVDVATTYHNMGKLHHDLGDHQQAKEYYERALSILLNKLGPDHVYVASTFHNMGILHKDLGEYQEAKEYYERALSVQLNKLGPDHVDVACTYRLLGDVQHVLDAQQLLALSTDDHVKFIQPK